MHKDGLPETGFVRLSSILAPTGPIPVGKSTWWAGVKSGRFPKPIKLAPSLALPKSFSSLTRLSKETADFRQKYRVVERVCWSRCVPQCPGRCRTTKLLL